MKDEWLVEELRRLLKYCSEKSRENSWGKGDYQLGRYYTLVHFGLWSVIQEEIQDEHSIRTS